MDLRLKHPFTMVISGPTSSGKSVLTERLLKSKLQVLDTKFKDVLLCYSEWHPQIKELEGILKLLKELGLTPVSRSFLAILFSIAFAMLTMSPDKSITTSSVQCFVNRHQNQRVDVDPTATGGTVSSRRSPGMSKRKKFEDLSRSQQFKRLAQHRNEVLQECEKESSSSSDSSEATFVSEVATRERHEPQGSRSSTASDSPNPCGSPTCSSPSVSQSISPSLNKPPSPSSPSSSSQSPSNSPSSSSTEESDDERTFQEELSDFVVRINMDGVEVSKSGVNSLFTILGHASNLPGSEVFKIGLYQGSTKPESLELFLEEFVSEITNLIENGFEYNGKTFDVKFHCLICDIPAKSFVLNTKGHAGLFCCTKCEVSGRRLENRTCFDEVDCRLRTDTSFREKSNAEHHNGDSPLTRIPGMDMIKDVVYDPFHLVTLYGEEHVSINVHALCHLCDDVRRFGPIDRFSAFPYENENGVLLNGDTLPGFGQPFSKYAVHCDWKIGTRIPNNCIMTKNHQIFLVQTIAHSIEERRPMFIAREYTDATDLYTLPRHSSSLYIYQASALNVDDREYKNLAQQNALPFEDQKTDWELFPGKLLRRSVPWDVAKQKAQLDKIRKFIGNVTTEEEGTPSKRSRAERRKKKFDDFCTDEERPTQLLEFPSSPSQQPNSDCNKNKGPKKNSKPAPPAFQTVRKLFVDCGSSPSKGVSKPSAAGGSSTSKGGLKPSAAGGSSQKKGVSKPSAARGSSQKEGVSKPSAAGDGLATHYAYDHYFPSGSDASCESDKEFYKNVSKYKDFMVKSNTQILAMLTSRRRPKEKKKKPVFTVSSTDYFDVITCMSDLLELEKSLKSKTFRGNWKSDCADCSRQMLKLVFCPDMFIRMNYAGLSNLDLGDGVLEKKFKLKNSEIFNALVAIMNNLGHNEFGDVKKGILNVIYKSNTSKKLDYVVLSFTIISLQMINRKDQH
ncbi:hypothetical protein B566_EDAN013511 [Ephemera danica]|nr:hypothetical protein B566_EDAN013511 [Ephemera danica]